jgi:miniconductance mechanosensitive channel
MKPISTSTYAEKFRDILHSWGFADRISNYIVDFSGLAIVFISSIIIYYILKFSINHFLKQMDLRSKSKWNDYLYINKVFTRLAMVVPALVIKLFLGAVISDYPSAIHFIVVILELYTACIMMLVAVSFLNAVYHIYGDYEFADSKPIKGYVQIGKIIVFLVGGIIIISMMIGQSPLNLLAGLGAMSAVLLLIFKDSILGFVAGVQISSSHMLMIGDWMTMPKYNVDGVVIDISLVIVKVRNFDNSISTIPTYSLISESFQNWRGLMADGGRRIKRSVLVDMTTIRKTDEDLEKDLKAFNIPEKILKNSTNLGLLRWYIFNYLQKHPDVNQQMTVMVRTLAPASTGLPLELYGYCSLENLVDFEQFQSALIEHVISILPRFGLKVSQQTGNVNQV